MSSNPKRNGLFVFFLITFVYSWALWIPAALTGQSSMEFPTVLLYILGGFGPSIAGIIQISRYGLVKERRNFWRSVFDFGRIRPVWYALLFLTFPALFLAAARLSPLLGGQLPAATQWQAVLAAPAALVPIIIIGIFTGPLAEEFGWRGFALERMARRLGLLGASLALGLIWWAWHLPLFFIRGTTQYTWGFGSAFFWLFLANIFPLSIFLAWAFERNHRSILAAILGHFMYNFVLGMFYPFGARFMLIETVLLYLVAVALVIFDKKHAAYPERKVEKAPEA